MDATANTHSCGCQGTNHTLPKLVTFFREHGHDEASYSGESDSSQAQIPENLGLKSACAQCQLKTEQGVEEAISAIHCGPSSLVDQAIIKDMFMSLIELRLKHEGRSTPETREEPRSLQDELEPKSPAAPDTGRDWDWDWTRLWHEWAKAFELRRDKADVVGLLLDVAELPGPRHQGWWVSALQKLGAEALLTYRGYVSQDLVPRPGATELSALKRDVETVQSADDLFSLYVDIDARVYGDVYARSMLRSHGIKKVLRQVGV